ncbi:hypothetical protein GVAV_002375 [Gurleya vavrai]
MQNIKNSYNMIDNLSKTISKRKGENSTLLIIGGSELYVGAPLFAARSAMKIGFDLVYIMTQKECLIPLKILIPEAIVFEINEISFILNRINICIFGTGLGRPSCLVCDKILRVFGYLIKKNIFFIIDGDGFYFFEQNMPFFDIAIVKKNFIFTPNYNEFIRLKRIINCKKFMVIEKGIFDTIYCNEKKEIVENEGCKKRCGGQGDILTGVLAYFVCNNEDDRLFECMILACKIMRKMAYMAEKKHGRSLVAADILKFASKAFISFLN